MTGLSVENVVRQFDDIAANDAMLSKPKRQVDREYLDAVVEGTDCLVSFSRKATPCAGPKTPAHLRTRGAYGSDYQVICLCLKHHTEQGTMPISYFEEKYQINVYKEALDNLLRFKL
jgi:hypothetical protein